MLPERVLTTSIRIRASAGDVWRVLADTASWPHWNPTIVEFSPRAGLVAGGALKLRLDFGHPVGSRRFSGRLHRVQAERELSWTGGVSGVARALHSLRLREADEPGVIVLEHAEALRGLAVPIVWPWLERRLRARYEGMNEALRRRCESH